MQAPAMMTVGFLDFVGIAHSLQPLVRVLHQLDSQAVRSLGGPSGAPARLPAPPVTSATLSRHSSHQSSPLARAIGTIAALSALHQG